MSKRCLYRVANALLSLSGSASGVLAFAVGSISTPSGAQTVTPRLQICALFSETFLDECGGGRKAVSLGAKWLGPKDTIALASIGILLPELLPDMQGVQGEFFKSFLSDPKAIGTIEDITILGCTQARFAKVSLGADVIYEHGVGLCFGYTVNYYAQGALFAGGGEAKFRRAIRALERDIVANP